MPEISSGGSPRLGESFSGKQAAWRKKELMYSIILMYISIFFECFGFFSGVPRMSPKSGLVLGSQNWISLASIMFCVCVVQQSCSKCVMTLPLPFIASEWLTFHLHRKNWINP